MSTLEQELDRILVETTQPLEVVANIFRTYMDMPEECVVACTLFVAHTYIIDKFDFTSYLHITSSTHESGKTRLMGLLESLVPNPKTVSSPTKASITRVCIPQPAKNGTQLPTPTLIFDEVDTSLRNEEVIGILNMGNKRGAKTTITIPAGKTQGWTLREIDIFSPKILAGIGELPTPALRSRCIEIRLVRHRGKLLPRLGVRATEQLESVRSGLKLWAESLELLDPEYLPDDFFPEVLSDRQIAMWEPLLLIAQAADWGIVARDSINKLHKKGARSLSDAEALLKDIKTVFEELEVDRITTEDMAVALSGPDYEWGLFKTNKGVQWAWNPFASDFRASIIMAQILKPLSIESKPMRFPMKEKVARGYSRDMFEEKWAYYNI